MLDTVSRFFFLLHIPITVLCDLAPLYPKTPLFLLPHLIRDFYLASFNDPLLAGKSQPGGWFSSFLVLEAVLQLPACVWISIQFHRKREHSFSTRLIVFAYCIQVTTTTWACLAEILSFDGHVLGLAEKLKLVGFYTPYLIIPLLIAVDNVMALVTQHESYKVKAQYLEKRSPEEPSRTLSILITGANSGVGFGCVQRLIDESSTAMQRGDIILRLMLSVRSKTKRDSILERLVGAQVKFGKALELDFVYLDLTSMQSTEAACKILEARGSGSYDVLIFNAGMAEFSRIDLWAAALQTLSSPIAAITTPNYKIQKTGSTTSDGMGVAFQANFFAHYYVAKRLNGILKHGASVIWMSSLEATADALDYEDPQAIRNRLGYESSKRLIDIIWHESQSSSTNGIRNFCVHPGFCSTNIVSDVVLSVFNPIWKWTFYFARFCGSQFHTATAYNGGFAPAKIAIDPSAFAANEKWGSAGYWDGEKCVLRTEYDLIESSNDRVVRLVKSMESLRDQWINRLRD